MGTGRSQGAQHTELRRRPGLGHAVRAVRGRALRLHHRRIPPQQGPRPAGDRAVRLLHRRLGPRLARVRPCGRPRADGVAARQHPRGAPRTPRESRRQPSDPSTPQPAAAVGCVAPCTSSCLPIAPPALHLASCRAALCLRIVSLACFCPPRLSLERGWLGAGCEPDLARGVAQHRRRGGLAAFPIRRRRCPTRGWRGVPWLLCRRLRRPRAPFDRV